MTQWIRYKLKNNKMAFGQLIKNVIHEHSGELFGKTQPTGNTRKLEEVEIQTPVTPTNFLGLWNNFHSRAEKEGWDIPSEPLYFSKVASSYATHGQKIVRPINYDGPVYFEAELGIVIGQECKEVSVEQAKENIFGYTCVNDVTALEILGRDKSFPQWVRSKGFDTFCPFGPTIGTDVDIDTLVMRAILDGETKQEYKVSDMVFPPYKLVSLLSHYMTLLPGDVIACGTAGGSGPMSDGQTIEINIEGVGCLRNIMQG